MKEFIKAKHQNKESTYYVEKLSVWYSEFLFQISDKIYGKDSQSFLDVIDKEYHNIHSAMNYCIKNNLPHSLIKFSYLYWYGFLRGKWSDFAPFFDISIFSELNKQNLGQIHLANGALKWSNSNLEVAEHHLARQLIYFQIQIIYGEKDKPCIFLVICIIKWEN